MKTLSASKARANLHRLLDEVAHGDHPILITGKRANAVLVSEAAWSGMKESILEGGETPIVECTDGSPWRELSDRS